MSRTRLIRPAFFADQRMARLPVATRLVYIGLWTLADDAGYFEQRPGEIAVALFPYETPSKRQKRVDAALGELLEAERIKWLECGDHGYIPTLPEHGVIKGGNHAYTFKEAHEKRCLLTLFRRGEAPHSRKYVHDDASTDVYPTSHVSGSGSESGSGSVSDSGRAARGLKEAATGAGGFVGRLADRKGA